MCRPYRRSGHGTLTPKSNASQAAAVQTFKPSAAGQRERVRGRAAILTPDRRFLFATNGGDNSVSSFSVDKDGRLALLDVKPTGNAVMGKSGTAKSLVYATSKGILYVLHSFGPDHLRLMSVDGEGKLTTRPERYTANTKDKTDRVPTMAVLSPDGKFLLVGTTFDQPIAPSARIRRLTDSLGPAGRRQLQSDRVDAPDRRPVVFPVEKNGTLGKPRSRTEGGLSFLHRLPARPAGYLRPLKPSATGARWAPSMERASRSVRW